METFLNSFGLVFLGEMGDKTQLLALLLASRFRRPWAILVGIFVATVLNHALAAIAGGWAASFFNANTLRWILAVAFFAFGAWILVPDKAEELKSSGQGGVFLTTTVTFFLAEMGDKTQVATIALGARYESLALVTIGTTLGMLAANAPAVFFGDRLLARVPMRWVRIAAASFFVIFGIVILMGR